MMQEPLVSVIIPTYNRAALIGETIQSVLDQTYSNWELIIVDDGSTDNTKEVIDSFQNNKITYLCIEHCGLLGKIRNEGITKSNGEFIASLDSDDLWTRNKLKKQVEALQRYSNASFIFNNVELFGETEFNSPPDYDDFFIGNVLLPVLSEARFIGYPSALLFRKEILKKIGLMSELLIYGSESRHFLTMCQNFDGIFINDRLVKIRKHNSNTSARFSADVYADSIATLKLIYSQGSIEKSFYHETLSRYFYKMGVLQLHSNEPKSAIKSFSHYIKITPLDWKGYIRLAQALACSIK